MEEQHRLSREYPAVVVAGHRLHVFQWDDGEWEIWLNTMIVDFDGLCIAASPVKGTAIQSAIETLATISARLSALAAIEKSAQPCGCDPGAHWVCERHRTSL